MKIRIAEQHGVDVRLDTGPDGTGLAIQVRFLPPAAVAVAQ